MSINNYWIFQGNPKKYDFETGLKNDKLITDWTVSNHKDKIKTGDKAIIWLTGSESGCYALAKVVSEPHEKKSSSDDHLWNIPDSAELKVDIQITHNLVDKPILGKILKHSNRMPKNAGTQGTNFLSNDKEYKNILELTEQKTSLSGYDFQSIILSNNELCKIFQCSPQSGMRRSLKTNTLVLVSNHVKSIYDDKWKGDTLHYTGMGGSGDQSLNFMQNPTLNESVRTDIEIHLFEVFEEKQYFYQGRVKLKSDPYQESQTDENGQTRKVWMFPLEIIDGKPARIEFKTIETLRQKKEKKVSKISSKLLKQMVESQPKSKPSKRTTSSETIIRDEKIVKYALKRANGVCELCNKNAPFVKEDGSPFLEVHHIDFLSNGGHDGYENVSALCPNCHRKMHYGIALENDIAKLKEKAKIKLEVDD